MVAKKRNGPRVMDRPRVIGLGAMDGGYSKTEARREFLQAVDRVEPRVRQELLELAPLVGSVCQSEFADGQKSVACETASLAPRWGYLSFMSLVQPWREYMVGGI